MEEVIFLRIIFNLKQGIIMAFLKQLNTLIVSITLTLMLAVSAAHAKDQTISDRVMHYRAIDSVVWAMPLLNFKQFRDGHRALGVKQNDIAYHTKIQDWKFQTATPNKR